MQKTQLNRVFHTLSDEKRKKAREYALSQATKMCKGISHREFAQGDAFRKACDEVGIEPTVRQAAKYRQGRGQAFQQKGK